MGLKFSARLICVASLWMVLFFLNENIISGGKIRSAFEIKYQIPGAYVFIRQQLPFHIPRRKYSPPTENILIPEDTTPKSLKKATTEKDEFKDFYDYWFSNDGGRQSINEV